ncbi:MAG: hypothetical protein LQ346_000152 [Caloplaca aetnensis]|nr:MAG: hypothetical protein LQ346_000152 [Caloplaca aetnensis]
MYFSLPSVVALSIISLLQFPAPVYAGHSRFHRHQAAKDVSLIIKRDPGPGMVEIPIGDLQLLQMEMTAFQDWMHSWISTANASDPATNLAQLKLEFQAYDGWMTAWLDSTLSPSAPPPLPSSIPVTAPTTSTTVISSSEVASSAEAGTTSAPTQQVNVQHIVTSTSSEATPETTATTSSSKIGGEFFQQQPSSGSAAATTLVPVFQAAPTLSVASIIVPSSFSQSLSVVPSSTASAIIVPTSQPAAPESPPSSGSSSFNAQSSSNLAVYYGQSPATSQTSLAQMCQDPSVDIVILAFLTTFFGPSNYPSLNLGAACGGPSTEMTAAGATGLLSCPTMEADIKTCQSLGKKVLLSLGGAEATTAFSSDGQASDFATKLWDLFGGGNGESADMRPFGSAVLDGFDVDNEDHSTAFYSTFVSSLRSTMNADSSKTYYISAAPQCPRPDASIPLDAMQQMDFVFVQFYNNGDCNIGQPGFEASLKAWSQDLSAGGSGPKLYIGAPGCTACAGSGYLGTEQMGGVLERAKAAGLSNLGGVMLWDGPEGKANVQGGKDFLSAVKTAMG